MLIVSDICIGSAVEAQATLRHGAAAIAAFYESTIPIFTVIVRRTFGVAGGAFADPRNGQNFRVTWYNISLIFVIL